MPWYGLKSRPRDVDLVGFEQYSAILLERFVEPNIACRKLWTVDFAKLFLYRV